MSADSLTSIFQVADSVVFVCGVAVGVAGRNGVNFVMNTTQTLRGKQTQTDDTEGERNE